MAFFRHKQAASSSKEKVLKDDCQLFSGLFISCQTRQCDKNYSSMRISPPLPLLVTVANLELDLPSPSLAREPTRGTAVWPSLCTSNFLEP